MAFALLAVVVLVAGVWLGNRFFGPGQGGPGFEAPPATLLPEPRALVDFSLTDHRAQPFNRERLIGHWTLAFFGYTHCPDVCPNTMAVLNLVTRQLAGSPGGMEQVQVVFISVDPERDTLEQLASYVPYFNEDFIGATGSPEELLALARQVGVLYMRTPGNTPENYLVDHSASIMLLDPQGRWHAIFPAPHDPAAVAGAFAKIREHYPG